MAKKRTFSISMTRELKDAMDRAVTEGRFIGRSRAIEYYVRKGCETEARERELLERRERELNEIWEVEQGKLDLLLEFFKAADRHPEIMETMRQAFRQLEGR